MISRPICSTSMVQISCYDSVGLYGKRDLYQDLPEYETPKGDYEELNLASLDAEKGKVARLWALWAQKRHLDMYLNAEAQN